MVRASSPPEIDPVSAQTKMRALYDAHARAVYRYLLRLTFGHRQAAEDLTQETMLRAWRNIDGLHTDVEKLRPWLLTVARRVAIDAGRARLARPQEVGAIDEEVLPALDDAIERMLGSEVIRAALARMTPEHRSVIIEVYYRDRSPSEAADRLGIPEGTVKSRTHYAVRTLRAALGSR